MKKIIQEGIIEKSEYYCDVHPDRKVTNSEVCAVQEGFRKTITYNNTPDLYYNNHPFAKVLQLSLCDECMEDFWYMIYEKFKIVPEENPSSYSRHLC